MIPGPPAICEGTVFHRRVSPVHHEFSYPVSYVWIDPDDPGDLCRHHPLWSADHLAPARFRASDYGDGSTRSLATQVRDDLALVLDRRPSGPVRMLSQVRRWGWLFNPITLFVAWDADARTPAGAVLEVTNTPWKQRHRYAIELRPANSDGSGGLAARVAKSLHVSPFLDEAFDYVVKLSDGDGSGDGSGDGGGDGARSGLALAIDVMRPGSESPVLATCLRLGREPASRESLTRSLVIRSAPTHRVSAAIHTQAARLWAKRVPIVAHPRKRKVDT